MGHDTVSVFVAWGKGEWEPCKGNPRPVFLYFQYSPLKGLSDTYASLKGWYSFVSGLNNSGKYGAVINLTDVCKVNGKICTMHATHYLHIIDSCIMMHCTVAKVEQGLAFLFDYPVFFWQRSLTHCTFLINKEPTFFDTVLSMVWTKDQRWTVRQFLHSGHTWYWDFCQNHVVHTGWKKNISPIHNH